MSTEWSARPSARTVALLKKLLASRTSGSRSPEPTMTVWSIFSIVFVVPVTLKPELRSDRPTLAARPRLLPPLKTLT